MSANRRALPEWKQAIIAVNQRKAKATACKQCGAHIAVGLDDDQCALPAAADPTPLTWAGELAARLNGRRTYEIAARELWHRYREQLRRPAPDPVLPEHRCNDPVPTTWLQPVPPLIRDEVTDVPPY